MNLHLPRLLWRREAPRDSEQQSLLGWKSPSDDVFMGLRLRRPVIRRGQLWVSPDG
jgi:hypothetical protein